MSDTLDDDQKVTVCSECLRACCWHGEIMCEDARHAYTTVRTVAELRKLGLEHPSHWVGAT